MSRNYCDSFYPTTIWERCWWVNNAWIPAVAIVIGVLAFIFKKIIEPSDSVLLGLLFVFVLIPIGMFAALYISMFLESLFLG